MSSQYVECTVCHTLIGVNLPAVYMRDFENTRKLQDRDLLETEICVSCWECMTPGIVETKNPAG